MRILERDGRPLSVGRKSRSVPPALRRALQSRDGGCRFPGCCERRFVDAHHIAHWARGGPTDLSNLVQLCRHHHRLLHEGGYQIERRSRGGLVFRRPDGRRLAARPVSGRGDHREPARQNARRSLSITPATCVPNWDGARVNHGWEIERLSRKDPRFPPD
ncbi:MAG: HNH endonuclease signature motif containing protein [Thermoleophilaceae bacterium]